MKPYLIVAAASAAFLSVPATAQSGGQPSSNDRLQQILGTLFGQNTTASNTLDAQWRLGRSPLANQRGQFDARVDADVRAGALSQSSAARLKAEYATVVQLEQRYGADGVFTTTERTALVDSYGELTQALADGGYADNSPAVRAAVAEGRVEFNRRVDASVLARRMTRVAATRLKADYAALVQVEANYLRDGRLTDAEGDSLDEHLDALEARLTGAAVTVTPRTRLDAIARALPLSRMTVAARFQLRTEHGDLVRLASAYERMTPTADERAYLERRLVNLESRARVAR